MGFTLRDQDFAFSAIEQLLKVIMNSSYGIMGFVNFQFFKLACAELITHFGRDDITRTIEYVKSLGDNNG